jgi:hypothetical protein
VRLSSKNQLVESGMTLNIPFNKLWMEVISLAGIRNRVTVTFLVIIDIGTV